MQSKRTNTEQQLLTTFPAAVASGIVAVRQISVDGTWSTDHYVLNIPTAPIVDDVACVLSNVYFYTKETVGSNQYTPFFVCYNI